jgi:aspartyl protease family protein
VDAVVMEGGLTIPLLGMSFLNRTEMTREGETMVLVKRF